MAFPYLSDLLRYLTGLDLPLPLPMFGLLVAAALLISAQVLGAELRRKHEAGEIGFAQLKVKRGAATVGEERFPPDQIVSELTMVVFIVGIFGSRLFHIFEHFNEFLSHPGAFIWTRAGLSIFGGLTLGTIAGIVCLRRWQLPIRPCLDAVAPAMMLGYAIGRIGCQISGDGDWGIAANLTMKPDWLPTWFWAQTYTGNIFGEVIPLPGVYPAPVYETISCLLLFAVLWSVRKRSCRPGWLFSLYLLLAGLERLAIEQIRVNPVLNFGFVRATQAEFVATLFIVGGCAGLAFLGRHRAREDLLR